MKYVIITINVIIIMIGSVYLYKKSNEKEIIKKVEIGELTSLYFSYSKGYMMNANIRYEFKFNNETNTYIALIKPYLVNEEDNLLVEVDETFKNKLKEILIKYDVGKWDGFSKSDKDVLDGDSFSFTANFKDKTSIHTSGYMMWPENYYHVREELDTLFMNLYNEN